MTQGLLNLHGMTQAQAYKAFGRLHFRRGKTRRAACPVITGRPPVGQACCATQLPVWLSGAELRTLIATYAALPIGDIGGLGALVRFFLLLSDSLLLLLKRPCSPAMVTGLNILPASARALSLVAWFLPAATV